MQGLSCAAELAAIQSVDKLSESASEHEAHSYLDLALAPRPSVAGARQRPPEQGECGL